jgi:hypothetical protein
MYSMLDAALAARVLDAGDAAGLRDAGRSFLRR